MIRAAILGMVISLAASPLASAASHDSGRPESEKLQFLEVRRTPEGSNRIAVGVTTGDLEIEGLCAISEPSGTTLLCAATPAFAASAQGRDWLAEKIHGLPQASFRPSSLRKARFGGTLLGGRRGDTRTAWYLFATWPDGKREERRLEGMPLLAPIPQGPRIP